ncbi:exosortase/archaeosortase family protein [Methylomarinum vadi]|uniref:exosortase/archaeosortase family protein n=1 Tax=Methylomarinum vadi TaxID=438855 RepID=UPI002286BBE3|nr:exosortase/archaeosortase family protein [Methylomarinum vadi]
MSEETLQTSDSYSEPQQPWLLYLVLSLFLLVFGPTTVWLYQRWTMSVWQNGHGILVTLLVIYLLRGELKKTQDLARDSSPVGFLFLVPALLMHMLDTGMHSQILSAIALFLALPGLAFIFLGSARTKPLLFPLFSLFLTLPIPLVFTESIHFALRVIATDSVAWLLKLSNVPVYATGTTLQVEHGTLQVADACSGFSTLYAAITIAILTAYFCHSVTRRIVVLLIAAPLAIVVNIARVMLLILLVNWFGLDVLATSAHELSGLLTFMVALPIIFYIGRNPEQPQSAEN